MTPTRQQTGSAADLTPLTALASGGDPRTEVLGTLMATQIDRKPEVIAQRARIDALDHQQLAMDLIGHMDALPSGSVISIQGSWGAREKRMFSLEPTLNCPSGLRRAGS